MNFKQLTTLCEGVTWEKSNNNIDWEKFVNDQLQGVEHAEIFKQWWRETKLLEISAYLKYLDELDPFLSLPARLQFGKVRLDYQYGMFLEKGKDWMRKYKQKPFLQSNEHGGTDLTF